MIRMILIGAGLLFAAGTSLYYIEQGQLDETAPATSALLRTTNGLGLFFYFMRLLYQWAPDGSAALGPDNTFEMYRAGNRPKLPHEEYQEELARQADLKRRGPVAELHPELHPETIEI